MNTVQDIFFGKEEALPRRNRKATKVAKVEAPTDLELPLSDDEKVELQAMVIKVSGQGLSDSDRKVAALAEKVSSMVQALVTVDKGDGGYKLSFEIPTDQVDKGDESSSNATGDLPETGDDPAIDDNVPVEEFDDKVLKVK